VRQPSSPEGRLPWMIALATVPIVIAGLTLKKHIEGDLRSLYVVAGTLIGIGIVMAVIDQYAQGRVGRGLATLTFADAILIGLAQTMAVVPGVSRSGATICMALLLGLTRSDAARFSFLLSIPAVAGAGIYELRAQLPQLRALGFSSIAVGVTVAGVVGYASIAWFLRWLGSHELIGFAIYRIVAGLALLGALAARIVSA
jgi:undecaprenyl-diphosphatase